MSKTYRDLLLELAAEYPDDERGRPARAKAELAASNPLVERPWLLLWQSRYRTFLLTAAAVVWTAASPSSRYAGPAAGLLLLASAWHILTTATLKWQLQLLLRGLRWLHGLER